MLNTFMRNVLIANALSPKINAKVSKPYICLHVRKNHHNPSINATARETCGNSAQLLITPGNCRNNFL
jgi:hypothetical protein